jgi:hypothetical protein
MNIKQSAGDFEAVYYPDGTCNIYPCGCPGVILAYDTFCPEVALWFCAECWNDLGIATPMFTIVQDKRMTTTLPAFFAAVRLFAKAAVLESRGTP